MPTMNPIHRRFKKPALIGALAILLALVFTWLALPGILQSQAERFIAEKTGHRLSLARIEINPFELSLRLGELRLVDPAGEQLLGFGELYIDLSVASVAQRAWVFKEVRLDGLTASLVQRKEGDHNWKALLDALQGKEPPSGSGGLPRVDIRHLRVSGAQMQLTDRRMTMGFATRIEPLDIELTDVSTLPDDAGRFKLSARTLSGAQLTWVGSLALNPIASSGRVEFAQIDLKRLAPLLQEQLPFAPPEGLADLAADYRMTQAGSALNLSLERISASASALRLQPAKRAGGPQLAIDRFEIKDGRFDLATRLLALGSVQLHGNRVDAVVGGNVRAAVLKVDDIMLTGVKVDFARRDAMLAEIALVGGAVKVRRDAAGRIDLQDVIDSLKERSAPNAADATGQAASKPVRPATAPAPWRFGIAHVTLSGLALVARDETVSPPVELALDNISAGVDGVSENLKVALPLRAGLDVRGGGRLEIAGKLTPADSTADLQLKLNDLSLKIAQAYVSKVAALDLAGGVASAAGHVGYGRGGGSYRGSFTVRDLRLNEAGTKDVFLAWKSLSSNDLALNPTRLDIALLSLDGLDTKLIIAKDKSTNLKRVLRQDATLEPAPATQVAPRATGQMPADAETQGFLVNIDRLRFRSGELDFADNSLLLPFGTRIHGLRGSIVGLTSRPGAPGQVELDGEVDEFGQARAVGQADFFNPTGFMDIKVVFRNVEMMHLTPYSATFAGRKINAGKLSLELEYKIKQRQLQGENRIVIDRLELGERVESVTAKDLPLDLAIAILTDSDGRIDLGLPVSGSLDDPQFGYGQIIWKAITTVLGKIVTAPFRALGALFGGSGEKIDRIAFEAGSGSLTPPEREKLVRLATVLNKRPGLALSVHGTWAAADRVALQDLQLRRSVADRSGQSAGAKGDPGPLTTRSPKVQSALESLFADQFGSAELAVLKEGFRKANPGQLEESVAGKMLSRLSGLGREKRSLGEAEVDRLKGEDFHAVLFERLRTTEVVKEDALQELATRRADYALQSLKAAGAPEARIRPGSPEKSEAEGSDVLLKLELGRAGG
jgi:uncharacterized protein involved in outer membrane biogenesis